MICAQTTRARASMPASSRRQSSEWRTTSAGVPSNSHSRRQHVARFGAPRFASAAQMWAASVTTAATTAWARGWASAPTKSMGAQASSCASRPAPVSAQKSRAWCAARQSTSHASVARRAQGCAARAKISSSSRPRMLHEAQPVSPSKARAHPEHRTKSLLNACTVATSAAPRSTWHWKKRRTQDAYRPCCFMRRLVSGSYPPRMLASMGVATPKNETTRSKNPSKSAAATLARPVKMYKKSPGRSCCAASRMKPRSANPPDSALVAPASLSRRGPASSSAPAAYCGPSALSTVPHGPARRRAAAWRFRRASQASAAAQSAASSSSSGRGGGPLRLRGPFVAPPTAAVSSGRCRGPSRPREPSVAPPSAAVSSG
mmetsp:Transcript_19020/g.67583  ORF Transcript_19020/g.67583 Transcript_19020/m.67583 type:complete len:374 (-) Transcript_19020:380-1501(-)